jgi:predicted dehydrogenase
MRDRINAAVIGLGVGERHILGYLSDPRCTLSAICDVDSAKLKEVGEKYGNARCTANANEILDDPEIDVVSIASFDNFHAGQILKAIAAKKHVFVEKPFCLTPDEYREIDKQLAANPDLHFSSNLVLRRAPQFVHLKSSLDSGKLGNVYYMEADYSYGRLHKLTDGWRGQLPFYSVSHGGAIHMIDLLLWLTGKIPTRVMALGNKVVTGSSAFRFPSQVTALLEFPDGTTGKVSANFPSVCPHHHAVQIYGDAGTFIHTYEGGVYYSSRDPHEAGEKIQLPYKTEGKGDVQKSFIAQILDGKKEDVTKADVFRSMAVSLAVEASLSSGNWENVNYGVSADVQPAEVVLNL